MRRTQCHAFIHPLDFHDLFKSKANRFFPTAFFALFIFFVQSGERYAKIFILNTAITLPDKDKFKSYGTFALLWCYCDSVIKKNIIRKKNLLLVLLFLKPKRLFLKYILTAILYSSSMLSNLIRNMKSMNVFVSRCGERYEIFNSPLMRFRFPRITMRSSLAPV